MRTVVVDGRAARKSLRRRKNLVGGPANEGSAFGANEEVANTSVSTAQPWVFVEKRRQLRRTGQSPGKGDAGRWKLESRDSGGV